MRIGLVDVARRPVSIVDADRLRVAWRRAKPPLDDDLARAALGLSITGENLPDREEGQDYEEYGQTILRVLGALGASSEDVYIAAGQAWQALPAVPAGLLKVRDSWADFFGNPKAPGPGPSSDSASGTLETPSPV